ncbi:MurR/RpiR family transcriptional regulator [Variovorax guangxiensis]|uniref:MurR/RpiR family transcriptional regulator n=1 Tax=Variovorax guangxiensis TaxID=1775474 RepID=A0A502DD49_9BURK|nr:MurR/RpiR family transcriptional regulator [Variovorax guangxiensis]TPG23505.1 MurR/RpiR family transcriptional regulator [Variovorax guangxiensis]TPG24036.1 MurR/RpiR family transcriptional regulator [Variovorax ginsengisoli]
MALPTPSSIDDLRRFVESERSARGRDRMGERTLAVLVDMLARPGPAAVQSISELAAHNGVDPSTLTRLGKRLGFNGFAPLQDVFRRHVSDTQPFYSARVSDLVSNPGVSSVTSALQQLARNECQKILAAASSLDERKVGEAVAQLIKAKNVYVLGLRGTYSVSHFFGTFLGTLRDSVTVLGGPGFPIASELARIKKDDLLVAISYRPYTRTVVRAVELIKAEGTPVLSLTDAGSAIELAPKQGVTIAVDQPYYFDSALAQFFAAEAILMAVARRLGPKAMLTIQRREAFNKALDIEIS